MTYEQNQILGRALTSSRRILENRCIVSVVEASQMEECGVTPGDLDGVVSQLRITKGVECAVFLYQTGEQEYKVSLRSNHYVNVAEIAASFGGGGHIRAAGCSMVGSPPEIIEQVAKRIALQLKKEE